MSPRQYQTVGLLPLPPEVFDQWQTLQAADYAQGKVQAGNWPAHDALERAVSDFHKLLPLGTATPHHLLFLVVDQLTQKRVGTLWLHHEQGTADAFIYNIEMDDGCRGGGYGSATLIEAEALLVKRGAKRMLLHVFGHNEGAQRLYRRLGFQTTNLNMAKALG